MFLIVPNDLREAIYVRVDAQLKRCPELAPHRDAIYRELLAYFDMHGEIPNFELAVNAAGEEAGS